jgi:hypothetical protein
MGIILDPQHKSFKVIFKYMGIFIISTIME